MIDRNADAKRKFIHKLRRGVRSWSRDPFIAEDMKDVAVEMIYWDKPRNQGLFVIYSRRDGRTTWDYEGCRYERVYFDSRFSANRIWSAVNEVLNYSRERRKNLH